MTKIPRKNGKRVTRRAKINVKPKKESNSGEAFSENKQKKRPGKMERKNQDSSLSRNSQGVLTMNSAKMLLDQEARPKTARGQRYLKNIGPQLIENTKKVLVIKGTKVSQEISNVLRDISLFLKPNCKTFTRKNEIFPFEDVNSLEYYGVKNNCSLIAFGSHNKKRPNNLVLARLFDGHILDSYEFGVDKSISIQDIMNTTENHRAKGLGSKPMVVFLGEKWESDFSYQRIQNLLLDIFRGVKVEKLSLKALDHVIGCSVIDGKIFIRSYYVKFKKSGSKVPTVELVNMGPFWDLSLRRNQPASDDLWKLACRQPKTIEPAKTKNITKNNMGDKTGRLYVQKQDFDSMATRRVPALRNMKEKQDTDNK